MNLNSPNEVTNAPRPSAISVGTQLMSAVFEPYSIGGGIALPFSANSALSTAFSSDVVGRPRFAVNGAAMDASASDKLIPTFAA